MKLDWATPPDDAALRQLLRETPVPGQITLSFEREPNYFAAAAIESDECDECDECDDERAHRVLLARDEHNALMGCASHSSRLRYVNGVATRVGYFSQLRAQQDLGGMAHARFIRNGFARFKQCLCDSDPAFSLMSLIAGNSAAQRLLTHGLPGFPHTKRMGALHTYTLNTRRARPALAAAGLQPGTPQHADEILHCLRRNLTRHQFAPVWQFDGRHAAHTPEWKDFWIVTHGSHVLGCVALWDQRAFKQSVVRGYAPGLARWRRLINTLGRFVNLPYLPAVGCGLDVAYLSPIAIDNDDPDVFATLLRAALNAASQRGITHVVIGLCAGHKLESVVRRYRHINYASEIFAVYWDSGAADVAQIDTRPMAPDIATL